MSRLKINTEEPVMTLDELVMAYVENKKELDSYKKICDKENTQIKEAFEEQELTEHTVGNYTVKKVVAKKEKFDEDKLVNFFQSVIWADKGSMQCPYIKTQYVVDWDAVENAIYHGKLTKEQVLEMDKYKEVTEIVTLRISKAKG